MNTLQSLVLPNLDVGNEETMYLRLNDDAWVELGAGCVHFAPGGLASTDTFYNGLTVPAWKRRAPVHGLALEIEGAGDFVATLGLHRAGQASVWLAERPLRLAPGEPFAWPVAAWPALADGLLFVRLRALGPGRLDALRWRTPDPPANEVTLGIVVTHFNRVAQVLPAVARIRRFVASRPDLQGRVTLTVVDNSRNLPLESDGELTVLPNRNLGGTGGFVRGLLGLVDGGRHTHALFMDDDASCEVEGIARCLALLQYAAEPALAVAGALLRESAPWHLVEKGARFPGQVQPLCPGLDLRRVDALLEAERPAAAPDYGAWWFFAFPIAAVQRWPFPFFVRGDDILFGLQNRFQITTLNGIACLGEDFSSKHGPLTAYLDARYHLVLALLGDARQTARRLGWVAGRLFVKSLTGYHYASARAVTLAITHVLEGPRFFREHLDLQPVRSEIAGWVPDERLKPLERSAYTVQGARRPHESKPRRLLRLLTLQGFLLPGVLLKDRMTVQDKNFHGRASAVFRYRRVLYLHAASGSGYVAEYDRGRFFAELRRFVPAFFALMRQRAALRRDYADGAREMGSAAFWRSVFADPPAPAPAPATPPETEAAAVFKDTPAAAAPAAAR